MNYFSIKKSAMRAQSFLITALVLLAISLVAQSCGSGETPAQKDAAGDNSKAQIQTVEVTASNQVLLYVNTAINNRISAGSDTEKRAQRADLLNWVKTSKMTAGQLGIPCELVNSPVISLRENVQTDPTPVDLNSYGFARVIVMYAKGNKARIIDGDIKPAQLEQELTSYFKITPGSKGLILNQ
jgi:hypothetical protein